MKRSWPISKVTSVGDEVTRSRLASRVQYPSCHRAPARTCARSPEKPSLIRTPGHHRPDRNGIVNLLAVRNNFGFGHPPPRIVVEALVGVAEVKFSDRGRHGHNVLR